jgi:alanine racemase
MEEFSKRTWLQVDLDAVEYNFRNIKSKLSKGTKVLCVLKADAYGHGAEFLVKEYERLGADWYGVSNIDEALQLRRSGALKPILIFGYTAPELAETLCKYNVSQALFSYSYAEKLRDECRKKNLKVKVHLKIDTGMSRIGFFSQTPEYIEKSVEEISKIKDFKELELEGIFTHFSVADDVTNQREYTLKQFDNFTSVISKLENCGIKIPLRHCCNSAGIVSFPEMHLDMVRAGVVLYGLYPSDEIRDKIDLKPVAQFKTVVSQVKSIPKDTSVSYGRTFTSPKEMKIASISVGYADGYLRSFSNNAEMIVCGKRVPIVGRVCMDQLMLDVSNVPEVKEGDVVTVFGKDGNEEISVDELAAKIGTINYEITCLVGKRVSRIYYKNGEIVGKLSYI